MNTVLSLEAAAKMLNDPDFVGQVVNASAYEVLGLCQGMVAFLEAVSEQSPPLIDDIESPTKAHSARGRMRIAATELRKAADKIKAHDCPDPVYPRCAYTGGDVEVNLRDYVPRWFGEKLKVVSGKRTLTIRPWTFNGCHLFYRVDDSREEQIGPTDTFDRIACLIFDFCEETETGEFIVSPD